MNSNPGDSQGTGGYRRSTGSSRGLARRSELLARITDAVTNEGLSGFSLRRAAAVAGTTHKVLLYHFRDADDLLVCVVAELRARRIGKGLAAALEQAGPDLIDRVRALWPVLVGSERDALLQAVGLAIYDPKRYADLVRGSATEYLSALRAICPDDWEDKRKTQVTELILATMRGLLIAQRTEPEAHEVDRRISGPRTRLEEGVGQRDVKRTVWFTDVMTKLTGDPRPLTATLDIAASPSTVWSIVSDVRRTREWSPECVRVMTAGKPRRGSLLVGINRRCSVRWVTVSHIRRYEQAREIGWKVLTNRSQWTYFHEPRDGGTMLTETRRTPRGESAFALWFTERFLGGQAAHDDELAAGMQTGLERIKELAENGG